MAYKAQMRGVADWRDFPRATLSISVGAPYSEGDKLAAAVDLVNRRFESCIIDVADTLQRHNMLSTGMGHAVAMEASRRAGNEWLSRNKETLAGLQMPVTIVPWDYWLHHPEYAETRAAVDHAYAFNVAFHDAVEADVRGFLARRGVLDAGEHQRIAGHSREYLLEEAAAATLLERTYPSVILYPAHELSCMALIRAGGVPEIPAGMQYGRWAVMDFHRAGQSLAA